MNTHILHLALIFQFFTMHKLQMHAGVISKLLFGSAFVRATIHSLKLVAYLTLQTHKPYKYDLVLL